MTAANNPSAAPATAAATARVGVLARIAAVDPAKAAYDDGAQRAYEFDAVIGPEETQESVGPQPPQPKLFRDH